jgi:hypothetical protein
MNKFSHYCRKGVLFGGIVTITCLLQACPGDKQLLYSIPGGTKGAWEWVRTTTPTRVLTPQSVGYTKQLSVATDNQGAYIAFYRNDTLQKRVNETNTNTPHTFVDQSKNSVSIGYGEDGFVNYELVPVSNNSHNLIISDLLKPYSASADTVKSEYKKAVPIPNLYPY